MPTASPKRARPSRRQPAAERDGGNHQAPGPVSAVTLAAPGADLNERPLHPRTIHFERRVTDMRLLPILTATLAATIAVAACGGTAAQPSIALDGRTFLSTASTGHSLVPGSQVRLSFQGDTLGINAGCNSMGGVYQVVDGRVVTGQMSTTEMACAEPLMAQDQWISAFVSGAGVTLDGDTLTLAKDGVTLTLVDREVVDPDRPLLGTRWIVDGVVSGDTVSSLPVGVVAALTFSDGSVDVESGCNRGSGGVEVLDATMSFGPIAMTKMACAEPAMSVEAAVTAVLSGEVAYHIEADTLTLTAFGKGLILRAMP